MNYQNYIWDLGGTLMDNYESSSEAFLTILEQLSTRKVSREEIYKALKISTEYAIERYAKETLDFLPKYRALESITLQRPILFEGAKEVLEELQHHGASHFLISHRDNQVLEILRMVRIDQYFIEVITANNGFSRKPAPDSILYLLRRHQLNPEKTVVIGDRKIDVEAGRAANIETIYFDPKEICPEATHNIHQLKELIENL